MRIKTVDRRKNWTATALRVHEEADLRDKIMKARTEKPAAVQRNQHRLVRPLPSRPSARWFLGQECARPELLYQYLFNLADLLLNNRSQRTESAQVAQPRAAPWVTRRAKRFSL